MSLKVAIIGSGLMGKTHAAAYKSIEGVEITSIVDPVISKADELASLYGCKAFSSLNDAVKTNCDIIDICTPTNTHRDSIILSLQMGKNVVCEKPLSLKMDECKQIITAVEDSKKVFMVAHVVQFFPEYRKLAEIIVNSPFSKIKMFTLYRYGRLPNWSENNWMLDDKLCGGVIFDLGIHEINFLVANIGIPKWVFAQRSYIFDKYTAYVNAILGYDQCNILLETGFIMPIDYPFTSGYRLSCVDEAYEYNGSDKQKLCMYKNTDATQFVGFDAENPYVAELSHFVDCVNSGSKPQVGSVYEATDSVRLARAIADSYENSTKVYLQTK